MFRSGSSSAARNQMLWKMNRKAANSIRGFELKDIGTAPFLPKSSSARRCAVRSTFSCECFVRAPIVKFRSCQQKKNAIYNALNFIYDLHIDFIFEFSPDSSGGGGGGGGGGGSDDDGLQTESKNGYVDIEI